MGGLDWCFGILGFPSERDDYLSTPLEFQTTGPQTTQEYH